MLATAKLVVSILQRLLHQLKNTLLFTTLTNRPAMKSSSDHNTASMRIVLINQGVL
jgi:hypothetical protein